MFTSSFENIFNPHFLISVFFSSEIKNRLNLVMPNRTNSPSFKDTSPSPRIDSPTPKPKQGSPFYAEPADSIAQVSFYLLIFKRRR